jgi:hypothetical protein
MGVTSVNNSVGVMGGVTTGTHVTGVKGETMIGTLLIGGSAAGVTVRTPLL